ncbi:Ecdysteroid UDP-glucosyltransferase [Papilio machaon]|uniref:Ecdysteroid UDP-glucosyltransferase n=1 Tax=Papilio machaon TaxID=76193 RepID=A0A194RJU8_PAPMA|nr:Ecdysteroid UDP-glucosyltransferase [Papilio machaon]
MQARSLWLMVVLCAAAHAARLLAVLPTNTRSHYAMYGRLIEALAKRQHHITVLTHFPMKNPPPNVEEISLAGTIPEITNNLTRQHNTLKPHFIRNLEQIMKECVHACETVSQLPAVKALVNSTLSFDLVIVEVFGSECFLPFGRRFQAPIVGVLSSVPLPWVNEQLGNPEATAYVPAYMMSYGQQMSLWERLVNTLAVLWSKFLYQYKSQMPSQLIADRLFGPGPKLEELAKNYSLVLSNSHFSINEVRPLVPALVEVGGLHLDDSQTMPRELKTIMDKSYRGVVYWSFGSMSRIETIPKKKLEQIFEVLSELPQTVLVKMNRRMLARNITVPDNVYTMDWIPQYKTLCHPNTKLFVSHGGLLGTQEAVACGVPMLTVPLYADQALNGRAMRDRGVALTLTLKDSSKESWREALQDLIKNPVSPKHQVVRISRWSLGTQEAVACGVPMLTVPLYADQALNGRAMRDRGVALTLTLKDSSKESWREALQDLIKNPVYKQNAMKLRAKFLDRLQPPLETAVYWIEYVLRHQGATHMRSPAQELSLIQYLLLDIIAISVATTLLTVFILHLMFRYLCTRCIRWWPKEKLVFENRLFRRNRSLLHCLIWLYKFKGN